MLLLLILGRGNRPAQETPAEPREASAEDAIVSQETRLTNLLREIDGVGEVHVLLSYRMSAETEYVSDEGETVILSAGSGKEEALVRRINYPIYQGAVIVCVGGNRSDVKLHVAQAVSRFTGLGTDAITVLALRQ